MSIRRSGLTLGESLSLCPSWPLSRDIWRNVQGPLALNGDPPGAVVLHFHGGGFVGQTSWSHQTYTRKWANSTGFPVLSCDYRLAPEHRFPAAVDDAWLCYLWVRAHAERCLGVPPSRIILAGDSAGGNLCAAIAVRAIQRNVPLPMGLLLAYPVMCVSRDVFYPSMLSCLEETMVPFGFLLVCLDAYVSDRREAISNPELSPGVATDDILQRFPPTRLMVGTNDPLLDQCIEFAERLRHLDRNVDLQVYPQFGHGFLSFDNLCTYASSMWGRRRRATSNRRVPRRSGRHPAGQDQHRAVQHVAARPGRRTDGLVLSTVPPTLRP